MNVLNQSIFSLHIRKPAPANSISLIKEREGVPYGAPEERTMIPLVGIGGILDDTFPISLEVIRKIPLFICLHDRRSWEDGNPNKSSLADKMLLDTICVEIQFGSTLTFR